MSIEQAIAENTQAIRDLIAVLSSGPALTRDEHLEKAAEHVAQANEQTAPAKEKPAKAEAPKSEASATPEQKAEPAAAAVDEATDEPAAEVTYQDAAAVITKLSRVKGREAAVAVLEQFGAANLKAVKPEQFADVIRAAEEAMA